MSLDTIIHTVTIIFSIANVAISFLVILTIWGYYFVDEKQWTVTAKWSVSAIICFGIYSGFSAIMYDGKDTTVSSIIGYIYFIFWRLGTSLIYVLFLKRFQCTFRDTKYDISTAIYTWIYRACILFVLLDFIVIILHILFVYYGSVVITYDSLLITVVVETILSAIIDLTVTVMIVGIFVYKLWVLTNDIGSNYIYPKQKMSLDGKQITVIDAMSKITILTLCAIISSQLLLFYQMITFTLDVFQGNLDKLYDDIQNLLMVLDTFINLFCVIFSFDFAFSCYRYTPCYVLDWCCNMLCKYHAKHKQLQNVIEMKQNLLHDLE
eukprot:534669_1